MAEQKTKPTRKSVEGFIKSLPEAVQADCRTLVGIMKRVSGLEPTMWGAAMIGFGQCHYKYPSGHEGDTFVIGFSPRKAGLSLYLMCGFRQSVGLLQKLGKHKTAVGCLYIKKLADVDLGVLEELIEQGFAQMKQMASTMAAR